MNEWTLLKVQVRGDWRRNIWRKRHNRNYIVKVDNWVQHEY